MKKQRVYQSCKMLGMLWTILLFLCVNIEVKATSMEQPLAVNQGLFEIGVEECFAPATKQEKELPWINAQTGEIVWRIGVEENLSGTAKIEVFKEKQLIFFDENVTSGIYDIPVNEMEYEGYYRLLITDVNGNQNEILQWIKADRNPALIKEVGIQGKQGSDPAQLWYGAEPLKLTVEIACTGARVSKVVAETEHPQTFEKEQLFLQEVNEHYVITLEKQDFQLRTYRFYVVDEAGNEHHSDKTISFKRDSQSPNPEDILISFHTSDLDSNSISYDDIKGNPIKKLQNFINHLFVKKTVTVTFYVPDVIVEHKSNDFTEKTFSGVARLKIKDQEEHVYELEAQEEFRAYKEVQGIFKEDLIAVIKPYSVFSLELSMKSNASAEEIVKKLIITELEDYAGNVCKLQDGLELNGRIIFDDVAPILKRFVVESNSIAPFVNKNGLVYAKNIAGEDVKVSVVIEENPQYFDPDRVALEYSLDGITWKPLNADREWSAKEREQTLLYKFDGEENIEAIYQFRIRYRDCAGNPMIVSDLASSQVREETGGSYRSVQKVVIDHCAPKLTRMEFPEAVGLYIGETREHSGYEAEKILNEETKLYYDTTAKIVLELQDVYLNPENLKVKVYERHSKFDTWKICEKEFQIEQQVQKTECKCIISLPTEDGEYYFVASYTDLSGNPMECAGKVSNSKLGECYENCIREGCYTSPILVKDSLEPSYQVFYNQEPKVHNRVDTIQTVLMVQEKNLDLEQTKIVVSAKNLQGNSVEMEELAGFQYYPKEKRYVATWAELLNLSTTAPNYEMNEASQTLTLNLSTEAKYFIEVCMVDQVKRAAIYEKEYTIDRTAPSITVVTKEGEQFSDTVKVQSGLLHSDKSDVTYQVINDGVFDRILNKLTFGYFSCAKILVCVKVHDQVSGVENLVPICINEKAEETNYKLSAPISVEGDESVVQFEIELPMDFKGTVQMHGIDHAGNEGEDTGAIGMITESAWKHEESAENRVEVLTPYSKTPNYYSGDVRVKFYSADRYSGLYEVFYTAGNFKTKVTYPAGEALCTEEIRNHTISGTDNNTNHVELGLEFFDHAGYREILAKENLPVIHVDQTSPKIQVSYDNVKAENEVYYNAPRTATIAITERNFDPADTNLRILGPEVKISDWKHVAGFGCTGSNNPSDTYHTEACQWIATIYFGEEGKYTFTCDTTDLAGNTAVYGQTDIFIIDQTIPVVTVRYDNHKVQNGYYYKNSRVATIEIKEQNFDEQDVVLNITAQNAGHEGHVPTVSKWQSEGSLHWANVSFDYEGEFTFDVEYRDLAGNKAEDYEKDMFVIDLTAPELKIENIQDQSANSGVVAPVIRSVDRNYDKNSMKIELEGYHQGVLSVKGKNTVYEEGVEFQMQDFAHIQEADDLYTLRVSVCDLAGNRSEAVVCFSVNRFGSVYTFDEKTEALVGEKGSCYTKQQQNLVIYETNVDTLKFWQLTLNVNGKLKTLVEGTDFQVTKSGNEASWKQYGYFVGKDNFWEEGLYRLTIYSEDRAGNVSDNYTKGKKIEFIIDKTAPNVLITGVKNSGQYREKSKKILVDVEDNVGVASVEIILNGVKRQYTAEEIVQKNGQLELELGSSYEWQELQVIVYDMAMNERRSEVIKFLITPNVFVQYYRNQTWFYGSFCLFAVLGLVCMAVKKKKRQK